MGDPGTNEFDYHCQYTVHVGFFVSKSQLVVEWYVVRPSLSKKPTPRFRVARSVSTLCIDFMQSAVNPGRLLAGF